jgi:hypothetical protein
VRGVQQRGGDPLRITPGEQPRLQIQRWRSLSHLGRPAPRFCRLRAMRCHGTRLMGVGGERRLLRRCYGRAALMAQQMYRRGRWFAPVRIGWDAFCSRHARSRQPCGHRGGR